MCCFSAGRFNDVQEVHVSSTRIFARAMDGMRQALVYQMHVAADAAIAMILPLPVAIGAAEDSVQFVSLEGYSDFFSDLERCFPAPAGLESGMAAFGPAPRAAPQMLKVHRVGSFVASFVPSPRDFDRLDPRFRMPPGVFDELPQYGDWGFAVFQLKDFGASVVSKIKRVFGGGKPETKEETIHPMAFTFPRRDLSTIFFPTVHVHDGVVHPQAKFDHTLFVQHDGELASQRWIPGVTPFEVRLDVDRSKGLLDVATRMHKRGIHGSSKNEDTWVRIGSPIDAAA